jgi:putative FmdB family regulatory protein
MPIYEYSCDACDHVFELLQRVGAEPPEACPDCGEPRVRKLVSSTSFVLKGGGWYKDGYGLNKGSSGSSGGGSKPTAKEESSARAAAK